MSYFCSMKKSILLFLLTSWIMGCAPAALPVTYHSMAEADHFSGAVQTHFGMVHVWHNPDGLNDIAFIPASDMIQGATIRYILIAPRLLDNTGWHIGNSPDNFGIEHGISLSDTDAQELSAALNTILAAPHNDSSYFHYSCNSELDVTPSTITTNARGRSSVTTGTGSVRTWVTTCEVASYLGLGSITLADGTLWTTTFPLSRDGIFQLKSEVDSSIFDLESKK
jgi:hypothetical protein